MSDKNAKDALTVKTFKTAAALRRAERKGKNPSSATAPTSTTTKTAGGMVVVRLSKNAKPLSAMGGVQKVLGPSRIRIPEYKLHRG